MELKVTSGHLSRSEITELDFEHINTNLLGIVNDLREANIFVSGSTGFFGRTLVENILKLNTIFDLKLNLYLLVRDLSNFREAFSEIYKLTNVIILEGDINELNLPILDISHAIHAAATSRTWIPPAEAMKTIIDGTENVMNWLGKCGVRRVLYVSSGAVYGQISQGLNSFTENFTGAPDTLSLNSAYGEAKRCAELKCAIAGDKYKFEFSIARCFSFVGPYLPLDTHFAVGNLVNDALKTGLLNIKGDGSALRGYLYSADLVVWLLTLLCKAPNSRAYNVGSDEVVTILQLAEIIRDIVDANLKINILGNGSLDGPRSIYVPDLKRAKAELNLYPKINLTDGLSRMLDWHCNLRDNL